MLLFVLGMLTLGGAARGATYYLNGTVPRYGSQTYDADDFYTTSDVSGIKFRYSENPYSSSVKAVRCGTYTNIAGYVSFAANFQDEKTLAGEAAVNNNQCFNINIDSSTTNYWGFAARIRA